MAEEDGLKELYEAQRDTQEKYAYFLLAAAGAVIGFAVTRSSDAPLTRLHVPLGFAVLCWGWSFYLGCRRSLLSQTIMHMNAELLRVQLGRSSLVGSSDSSESPWDEGFKGTDGRAKQQGWKVWRLAVLPPDNGRRFLRCVARTRNAAQGEGPGFLHLMR